MRAQLLCVGQRMPTWVQAGYNEYAKRLSRDLPLELVEIPLAIRNKSTDLARAIANEGRALQTSISKGAYVIALDERGDMWDSLELAQQLARWRMRGQDLAFLIGGPDGLAPDVLQHAEQSWSLSPLTLPHPLVRIVVAEQLYRAVSVLNNHPYHRG